MGTALVMPTNEVKMLIPKTAASLQRALRKPNAVVLRREEDETGREEEIQSQSQSAEEETIKKQLKKQCVSLNSLIFLR